MTTLPSETSGFNALALGLRVVRDGAHRFD
jgi:hypothetical protein